MPTATSRDESPSSRMGERGVEIKNRIYHRLPLPLLRAFTPAVPGPPLASSDGKQQSDRSWKTEALPAGTELLKGQAESLTQAPSAKLD